MLANCNNICDNNIEEDNSSSLYSNLCSFTSEDQDNCLNNNQISFSLYDDNYYNYNTDLNIFNELLQKNKNPKEADQISKGKNIGKTSETSKEIKIIIKLDKSPIFCLSYSSDKKAKTEILNKLNLPDHYSYEKIKSEILSGLKIIQTIKDLFGYDKEVKKIEYETSDENFKVEIRTRGKRCKKKDIIKEAKQLGRKKNFDKLMSLNSGDISHDKFSTDNILQKIKTHIHKYLIIFINEFLEVFFTKEQIIGNDKATIRAGKKYVVPKDLKMIKSLDSNIYVNKTSKEDNLKFLNMTLKEFLSQKINRKFITFEENANEITITKIMKENNENINFVFNLKLSEWIDVFLKKKEFKDLNGFNENINVTMNKRIDELLKEINENNKEKNFLSLFLICIYNFERILRIKKERKKSNKNKDLIPFI